MKKEIISGLALVTLSTLPANALNFGTGNAYDKYLACHKKNNQNISIQEAEDALKDTKLLPQKPKIKPTPIKDRQVEVKYGIPYPLIKPDKTEVIPPDISVQTRYMVPVPPANK